MNETEKLTELRYALIIEISLPCLFILYILTIHVADVVGNVAAYYAFISLQILSLLVGTFVFCC